MKRRTFFALLSGACAGAVAWASAVPRSVFAANVTNTNRYHPDLIEYGHGFDMPPEIIEDAERFHERCEFMRCAMLHSIGHKGPVNLWRIGRVNRHADPVTGRQIVTMRVRSASTSRLGWTMPPEGITVKVEGGPYHMFPVERT
jgi:hypothetical protein